MRGLGASASLISSRAMPSRPRSRAPSVEDQVVAFIDRYDPAIAQLAHEARGKVRKLLPGAIELVYDNYNALALAFGPSERPSELILSLALYPRWVSLFFTHGARLNDPDGLLRGSGRKYRHVVLDSAAQLGRGPVRALVKEALALHPKPVPPGGGYTLIQAIAPKQRPRRPDA